MKMHVAYRKRLLLMSTSALLLLALLNRWRPSQTLLVVDLKSGERTVDERVLLGRLTEGVRAVEHVGFHLKDEVSSRLPKNECDCLSDHQDAGLPFSDLLFPGVKVEDFALAYLDSHPDPESVRKNREQQHNDFQKRTFSPANTLIVAQPNSPLQFPTQGVSVRPLKSVLIPGLGLQEKKRSNHSVSLSAGLGVFEVAATVDEVSVRGLGQNSMTLSSSSLEALNRQLQFVVYTNTRFHPRTADTVQVSTRGHHSFFTIKVEHSVVPRLHNSGVGTDADIGSLVTIATKTLLRYDRLRDLIASVRRFYPHVTVVIADDNEHPEPVSGPHVEQYFMPPGKGWFAGRNLAVSQVTTKYLLWVDDDFYFTASTKLEKMVEILEKTSLDLVGGAVQEVTGFTRTFRHTIALEDGGEAGDCLHVRSGYYHAIDGFPDCVVADAVINFFMARTEKVQQVGFNPRLARRGHLEFFIDGLGSLHVGSCSDVVVHHASKIQLPWTKTYSQKTYESFRYSSSEADRNLRIEVFYFRNRLKCMTRQ